MSNTEKPFCFGCFYLSLLLASIGIVWFSQKSINAYWQQTYHQASPLEKLDHYSWWQQGATLQHSLNTNYQNIQSWLATQNQTWQNQVGKPEMREQYVLEKLPENRAISESEQVPDVAPLADDRIILSPQDKVLFAGDSMMQGVAPFIQKWLSQNYGIVSFNLSKQSTGLSYPSFFDWPTTIEKQLAEHQDIRLLLVFLGPNDPWDFPNPENKAQILRFKTPEWEQVYRSRVARIVEAAQKHQVKIIWYGIPYMKAKRLNAQMAYLDSVLEDELKNKALWIPTKERLSHISGKYSDTAIIDGKTQRVRSKDGIHFTAIGQKLLADEVQKHIHFSAPATSESRAAEPVLKQQ